LILNIKQIKTLFCKKKHIKQISFAYNQRSIIIHIILTHSSSEFFFVDVRSYEVLIIDDL